MGYRQRRMLADCLVAAFCIAFVLMTLGAAGISVTGNKLTEIGRHAKI